MKLTIDASIVVKWFVAEPLSDAAGGSCRIGSGL